MTDEISVQIGHEKKYSIIISDQVDFSWLLPFISQRQVLIVSNNTVAPLYFQQLKQTIQSSVLTVKKCILEDGETHKNSTSLDQIYQILLQNSYHRSSILIALGGGVIGDIAGFAAATYQRGVKIIQVPTTLLAQVDSSVGGKTAINHPLGKNMIGAFLQPTLVYIATDFLKTLPAKEFSSGMAEVIKYGCAFDADFFVWLEQNIREIKNSNPHILGEMIATSCRIKAAIVSKDEKEQNNIRVLLNLGHTFGHAIECCQQYQGFKHGEAVAVGIVMAAKLSCCLGYIKAKTVDRITRLLSAFNLPIVMPKEIDIDDLINVMVRDKKNINDVIVLVLLNDIGQAKLDTTISSVQLKRFLVEASL